MYPMITSTEEVEKIYAIVAEVEEELKKQEVQYKIPEQGIMIETPAAVMISGNGGFLQHRNERPDAVYPGD